MASLTLDWMQLAAVVGALQGLLLTGVIVAQKNNRTANRLLAALMAAFTIYLASEVYYTTGLFRAFPHFFGISYQMPWVYGPLVYLYAVAASDRSWRFERKALIHFLPVAINVLAMLPYYFMSGADKVAFLDRWIAGATPVQFAILDPFKYVSGIAYSVATVLYLRRHRLRVQHSYSNTQRVNLRWLLGLTIAAFGIWILATTMRISGVRSRVRDEHISLAMAALVYAIGYRGLRQPEVFRYETAEYPVMKRPELVPTSPPDEQGADDEPELSAAPRYERSGLSDIEARNLKTSLLALMDAEKPWRDSELTLATLAERLNSTPHKLSEVLNAEIGETFYDFVNGYRVREVQRRIKAGDARALKMLALALDAGFASKSTFNQAFKKHTSQTPSGFREAVGA
ncbi:MAG TPA: helix-turn-helix domain-containing protein [Gemmatimonadaceae bacterium]|nr:helix-turn-helix domain-containing protein [Gemmatimonadaceae bacterium]